MKQANQWRRDPDSSRILERVLIAIVSTIIIISALASCRSRHKTVETYKEATTETVKIDTNTIISQEQEIKTVKTQESQGSKQEEDSSGSVEIVGKTDEETGFDYHNIIKGDTVQTITITGTSDFIIKNHYSKTEKIEEKSLREESLDIIAQVARKSVAQSTIKDVAKEIKKTEKEIKATGFTLPAYLIIGLAILLLVLLWFLWRKFGGPIIDKIKNIV